MASADADDPVLTEKDAVLTTILNIAYADITKRGDDAPFAVQRIVPLFDALVVLVRHHAHHLLPEKLQSKSEMEAFLAGFRSFMKTDARFASLAEEATRAFDRDGCKEGTVVPAKTKESSRPQTSDPTVPEPYAAFRPATLDEVSVIGAAAPTGVAASSREWSNATNVMKLVMGNALSSVGWIGPLATLICDDLMRSPLGMPLAAVLLIVTKAFIAWITGEEYYGVSMRSSGWWVHALAQMLLWGTNAYLATVEVAGATMPLGTSLVVAHKRSALGKFHCNPDQMRRIYPSASEIMKTIAELQDAQTKWEAKIDLSTEKDLVYTALTYLPNFRRVLGPEGEFRGFDDVWLGRGQVFSELEIYRALSGFRSDDATRTQALKFVDEVQTKVNDGTETYTQCANMQHVLVVMNVLSTLARERDWVKVEFKKSEMILEKLNNIQEKGVVDGEIKLNTLKVMRAVFKTLFAEMQKSVAEREIWPITAWKMANGSQRALDIYTDNAKGRYAEMGEETKAATRDKVVAIMDKVKALGVALDEPGGPTPAPAPAPAGPPGQGPAAAVNDADVVDLLDLWNVVNQPDAPGRPAVSPARRRPAGTRASVVDAAYRARLRALRL
tara:strand:- start:162 stop:2000 length:1839 start_codon:yes stop_codon:yes gene_type:complete